MKSSSCGCSSTTWKRGISHVGFKVIKLDFLFTRFPIQCYSTRRSRASRLPKVKSEQAMDEEKDAFYVVRKGNMVGIYKSLSDCQAQVSSSICDPSVSVYMGHSLKKDTEDYLAARGLKNPLYTIDALDVKEELFGKLVPCPFQQPDRLSLLVDGEPKENLLRKDLRRWQKVWLRVLVQSHLCISRNVKKSEKAHDVDRIQKKYMSCTLEFDGASKGNPGKAGAGVILRAPDASIIARIRQGLGVVTNNVAEYRALILGLNHAIKKGFKNITVRGDSQLVCMQVRGMWQTKNQNMSDLCKVVKELQEKFASFEICHVRRDLNQDADAQANFAVDLPCGETYEEWSEHY